MRGFVAGVRGSGVLVRSAPCPVGGPLCWLGCLPAFGDTVGGLTRAFGLVVQGRCMAKKIEPVDELLDAHVWIRRSLLFDNFGDTASMRDTTSGDRQHRR